MKRKRFSVEQIVAVLEQAEVGVPVAELVRQVGISEQTFYGWKKHYTGMEVDQVRQLKQLQEENARLKRLVAELTLDKTMLQDVLAKNCKALTAPSRGDVSEEHVPGERTARLWRVADGVVDLPVSRREGSAEELRLRIREIAQAWFAMATGRFECC